MQRKSIFPFGFLTKIKTEDMEKLRNFLKNKKGRFLPPVSPYEIIRYRLKDIFLSVYKTGTIYGTPSKGYEDFYLDLEKILKYPFEYPEKENVLFGMDEVGKGEIIGDVFICMVKIPSSLFQELLRIFVFINTKNRVFKKNVWEYAFKKLKEFSIDFFIEKITVEELMMDNLNKLLDEKYVKLLKRLEFRDKIRVCIDDYGVGEDLINFTRKLSKKNVSFYISYKADEKFLECRVASFIAKIEKKKELNNIEKLVNLTPGTGNLTDKNTRRVFKIPYIKRRIP